MAANNGFHLLLQAAEVSRSCADYDSPSISNRQDFRELINGFVSPDSTSVDDSRVSSSLPPKKRLRLQAPLCQSQKASPVSPNVQPSSPGFLHKRTISVDNSALPDSLDRNNSIDNSMSNAAIESTHIVKVNTRLNANNIFVSRKALATTNHERKNTFAFEDAFGNSIQMGYFSGVNATISPEKQLSEVKKTPQRSIPSVTKERKRKPRDQDIFGNAIGMGYFSSVA
ncbi:hypothetical protein ACHAXS_002536 [Conticribra weissflogii]